MSIKLFIYLTTKSKFLVFFVNIGKPGIREFPGLNSNLYFQKLFWARMTETVGCIDERIQLLLDFKQLSATHWLGEFDDDDIKKLEQDVRNMPTAEFNKLNCEGEQASFSFNFIELKCLKCIISQINQKGIPYFIKQENSGDSPITIQAVDDPNEKAVIIQKIITNVSQT